MMELNSNKFRVLKSVDSHFFEETHDFLEIFQNLFGRTKTDIVNGMLSPNTIIELEKILNYHFEDPFHYFVFILPSRDVNEKNIIKEHVIELMHMYEKNRGIEFFKIDCKKIGFTIHKLGRYYKLIIIGSSQILWRFPFFLSQ